MTQSPNHIPDALKPVPLRAGDATALVTPLGMPSANLRDYTSQIDYVRGQGFECDDRTATGDTPAQRSRSFNEAIAAGYSALFPAAGNRYGADTLHRFDYDEFAAQRPLFVTFSAGSSLLAALHEKTGVPVFYGPHLRFAHGDEARTDGQPSLVSESFWGMLRGETDGQPFVIENIFSRDVDPESLRDPRTPYIGELALADSEAPSGRILPLFLQSLQHTIDAGIIGDVEGRLLMLESDQITFDEAYAYFADIHDKVDLRKAAAICIAGITPHPIKDRGTDLERDLYDPAQVEAFVNRIRRLVGDDMPVTYGFPMGHGPYKFTVPYGVQATLRPGTGDLVILESPFRTEDQR